MPPSPLTRLLAVVLVLAIVAPLAWPDLSSPWTQSVLPALPLVIMIFMWTIVRAMPVFDDRAFHRTLPHGNGWILWQMMKLPLWIAAGVAASLAGFCAYHNLQFWYFVMLLLGLVMPLLWLMIVGGVAASAGSSRGGARLWSWLAILLPPVVSIIALIKLPEDPSNHMRGSQGAYAVMSALMIAGGLYLPVWWLVVVRRRQRLGLILAAAIGLVLPWLKDTPGWNPRRFAFKIPTDQFGEVTMARKAPAPGKVNGEDERAEALLEIGGLKPGELFTSTQITLGQEPFLWNFDDPSYQLGFSEVYDPGGRISVRGPQYALMAGQSADKKTVWGRAAQLEAIRAFLPEGVTLSHWNRKLDRPAEVSLDLDSMIWNHGRNQYRSHVIVYSEPWQVWGSLVTAGEPQIIDPAIGGKVRLCQGGTFEVHPLKREDADEGVKITAWGGGQTWIVVVDEINKNAYLVDEFEWNSSRWSGGIFPQPGGYVVPAREGRARDEESRWRTEILKRCRLYVFWPDTKTLGPKKLEVPK